MRKDLLTFIAALVLFGSNGVVAASVELPSASIVVLRTLLGAVLLGALLLVRFFRSGQTAKQLAVVSNRTSAASVAVAGMCLGLGWVLLFESYALVGVSLASLLYYCGPVVVMALAPVLFAERLTVVRLLGFIAVLAGILLVNGTAFGSMDAKGLLCGAGSALCLAGTIVCNKKAEGIDGLERSFIQLAVACAVAVSFAVASGTLVLAVPAANLPAVLVLGLVNTGLGCYLYFRSVANLQAQTVAVVGYLEPVSALVFASLFLGEVLLPLQVAGAVLVVAGAASSELGPHFSAGRRLLPGRRQRLSSRLGAHQGEHT